MIRPASAAPGRRARRSLLLSGLIVAVGVASVAVCVGLLGGGPPLWVSALIAVAPLVVAVVAGFSGRVRRASTTVLVAASDFAGLAVAVDAGLILTLLVLGRFLAGPARPGRRRDARHAARRDARGAARQAGRPLGADVVAGHPAVARRAARRVRRARGPRHPGRRPAAPARRDHAP
ncbi:hypothetical protein ACFQV8_29770 [Pseudonocardia benzenivorans]